MEVTQRRRLEQYGKLKGGYRRSHTPGRKPEILEIVARWLSRPGGLLFAGKVGTGFSDKVRVRLSLAIHRITLPRTKSRGFASMHFVLGVARAGHDRLRTEGGGRGCDAPTCLLTITRTSSLKNTGYRTGLSRLSN